MQEGFVLSLMKAKIRGRMSLLSLDNAINAAHLDNSKGSSCPNQILTCFVICLPQSCASAPVLHSVEREKRNIFAIVMSLLISLPLSSLIHVFRLAIITLAYLASINYIKYVTQ